MSETKSRTCIEARWDNIKAGDEVHLEHRDGELLTHIGIESSDEVLVVSTQGNIYLAAEWLVLTIYRPTPGPVSKLPTLPGLYEMSGFPISSGCLLYRLTNEGTWELGDSTEVSAENMEDLTTNCGPLKRWDSITKVAKDIVGQFQYWFDSDDTSIHEVIAYIKDDYGVTE